jgi:hypothetical protein
MDTFHQLACLLKEKHPQVYGKHVYTTATGNDVTVGLGKGCGGGKKPASLGTRLEWRYNEVFRRGKVLAEKARVAASGDKGEPEKKRNKGGRPKRSEGVDTHMLDPLLTQLEKEELTGLLEGVDSMSEAELLCVMKYEKAGALVQDVIFNGSFSSAKAHYPAFFSQTCYLRNLFSSICTEKDIFLETEKNLLSEMNFLDEYLFSTVKQEVYGAVAEAKIRADEEGSKACFFFTLLRSLADVWEEDIEKVFFYTDKERTCRDAAVPHLVIVDGDYENMSLYVDRTLIFGQLSLSSGIPCLIAAQYLANLSYDEGAICLMTFLQQEICDLGRLETKKGQGKSLKKLSVYQAKKNKIIIRMYRGNAKLNV